MSCDVRKWECLYCTYLNWQSALQCTMCRSPKPLQVIEEGAPPPAPSFVIQESALPVVAVSNNSLYQTTMADSVDSPSSTTTSQEIQGACHLSPRASRLATGAVQRNYISNKLKETIISSSNSKSSKLQGFQHGMKQIPNKVTCPSCYTVNWASSTCNQCNTKLVTSQCLNQLSDDMYGSKLPENLKISELAECGNYKESTKGPNSSPAASPTKANNVLPQGAEKYNSSRSNSPNNANQVKWMCPVCTYHNWPRSGKCVMCMTHRPMEQPSWMGRNESNNASTAVPKGSQCVDSVMTASMANLSLGVNNPCPSYDSKNYEESAVNTNYTDAMRMRLIRGTDMDRRWLDACSGAVEGNIQAVEGYLASGGDPTRQLTEAEVAVLDRPSAFDIGFSLIHLALRFHQEDVLATLLSQVDGSQPVVKRVPSYAAPSVAVEIRRHVMASIRQRKGTLRCHFTSEIVTFTLPSEIDDMSAVTQETLFDEILDRDVQKELENGQIINWSIGVAEQLGSRLYALWNRSAGDCLLDSVLQATWGIFDRDNGLRRALSDSLQDCATQFYHRWKESELLHARHLNFSLNESQCSTDWAKLLSLASQPGSSLEQLHIFALAHILRRPIIVYGVKYVKSFRGEAIGFARYEGVYLPLLWEPSFCWRWPIALGYTRGHFSALVPMEPDCDPMARVDSATQLGSEDINERSTYLPLTTVEGALLPIQFLTQAEIGKEKFILGQWLDVAFTESGVMVARQRIQKRPLLVTQMVEEWLNHYRRLGQMAAAPYIRQSTTTCYSSEGESDND